MYFRSMLNGISSPVCEFDINEVITNDIGRSLFLSVEYLYFEGFVIAYPWD